MLAGMAEPRSVFCELFNFIVERKPKAVTIRRTDERIYAKWPDGYEQSIVPDFDDPHALAKDVFEQQMIALFRRPGAKK